MDCLVIIKIFHLPRYTFLFHWYIDEHFLDFQEGKFKYVLLKMSEALRDMTRKAETVREEFLSQLRDEGIACMVCEELEMITSEMPMRQTHPISRRK